MADERLDQATIAAALSDLHPGWTGAPTGLRRVVEFADFPTAVRFIDDIVALCEERNHHPDLSLSWREVTITLLTHSAGGVTAHDVELARALDTVIAGLPLASP